MDAFPAFIPLQDRRVIIVGEGAMADDKARLFEGSPAEVLRWPSDSVALEPETYRGAALVFIASSDDGFGAAAARAARSAGVLLVNVVDRPALCDFYTPAIVDRGGVVAAVGTTGAGPLLAQRLKAKIEPLMDPGLGSLALLLKAIQGEVRARFPDFAARREFLSALLDGPAAAAALAGRVAEAEVLARTALEAVGT